MLQLIYVSTAKYSFNQTQLSGLLRSARLKNTALGITGLLVYHERSFIQVLEGPAIAVAELTERIALDPGHTNFRVLVRRKIAHTNFLGWSMGFVNTSAIDQTGFLDYNIELKQTADLWDKDLAWWVLNRFRQGSYRQHVSLDEPAAVGCFG